MSCSGNHENLEKVVGKFTIRKVRGESDRIYIGSYWKSRKEGEEVMSREEGNWERWFITSKAEKKLRDSTFLPFIPLLLPSFRLLSMHFSRKDTFTTFCSIFLHLFPFLYSFHSLLQAWWWWFDLFLFFIHSSLYRILPFCSFHSPSTLSFLSSHHCYYCPKSCEKEDGQEEFWCCLCWCFWHKRRKGRDVKGKVKRMKKGKRKWDEGEREWMKWRMALVTEHELGNGTKLIIFDDLKRGGEGMQRNFVSLEKTGRNVIWYSPYITARPSGDRSSNILAVLYSSIFLSLSTLSQVTFWLPNTTCSIPCRKTATLTLFISVHTNTSIR